MKKTLINIAVVALIAVILTGCTTYYKVNDPVSGETYYTTEVKTRSSGAVYLKDVKSGKEVTIQNSEVQTISQEEYNVGIYAEDTKE